MADIKNERPYEEYIGLFKEAIHKSHGLCNNRIGQEIAKREGATVEDIIRLGSYKDADPFYRVVGGARRERRKGRIRQLEGYHYSADFKELPLYRYFKKKGIWNDSMMPSVRFYSTRNRKDSEYCGVFSNMLCFASMNLPEKVMNCSKLAEKLASTKLERDFRNYPENWQENGRRRNEFMLKEIEMYEHAPEKVLEQYNEECSKDGHYAMLITEYEYDTNESYYMSSKGRLAMEYMMYKMKLLKYMGIGIMLVGQQGQRCSSITSALRQLDKYIVQTHTKFISMIKKGYDASIVREEVINMINQWGELKFKGGTKVIAFERDDAQNEYDDIKRKEPKAKGKRGGSRGAHLSDEVYEQTINGKKYEFRKVVK